MKKILSQLFIPSENNDYRGYAFSPAALTGYLVVVVILSFLVGGIKSGHGQVLSFATDVNIQSLHKLVNEKRVAAGLKPLTLNETLSKAAAAKGADMIAKGYWAHFGPAGESPWRFILDAGYDYQYAGENLAKNFMQSSGVLDGWLASPTHRENIMNSHYTEVGYALQNGTLNGEETTLVVQMLGSRASPATAVATQPDAKASTAPGPTRVEVAAGNTNDLTPTSTAAIPVVASTNETPPTATPLNLAPIFKYATIGFIIFLVIAIIADLYAIAGSGGRHLRGKHITHLIFLVTILSCILYVQKGTIL